MGGMRLLLIESTPGNGAAIGDDLRANGHEVVACHDEHGGPCRGVADHDDCPLEQRVDMALVTRTPGSAHTLAEMGAVCAAQRRLPVLEVDPADPADDLPDLTVAHALGVRRVEAAYATAVRQALGARCTDVAVRRHGDRVVATVHVAQPDPATVAAVADRTRQALRAHDPFVAGLDICVVPASADD